MNRCVIKRAAVKNVVKMLQSMTTAIMAGSKWSTSLGLPSELKKEEFSSFGAIVVYRVDYIHFYVLKSRRREGH